VVLVATVEVSVADVHTPAAIGFPKQNPEAGQDVEDEEKHD